MKKTYLMTMTALSLLTLAAAGCDKKQDETTSTDSSHASSNADAPLTRPATASPATPAQDKTWSTTAPNDATVPSSTNGGTMGNDTTPPPAVAPDANGAVAPVGTASPLPSAIPMPTNPAPAPAAPAGMGSP